MIPEIELAIEAAISRHPAGKAPTACPGCDGRGKVTHTQAQEMARLLVGKPTEVVPLSLA